MKRLFDPSLSDSKRAELFDRLDLAMAEDYAWAVPDERALRILKHYGPIVEVRFVYILNAGVYFTVFICKGEKDEWDLHYRAENSLSNGGIFDLIANLELENSCYCR